MLAVFSFLATTFAATSKPTNKPSKQPTRLPTRQPTSCPSLASSSIPTSNPILPTFSPSCIPTTLPTTNPTFIPTSQPSYSPQFTPTITPTYLPSLEPTVETSSNEPNIEPTASPSLEPTASPTTESPSASPTVMPSVIPNPLVTIMQSFSNVPTPTVFQTTVGKTVFQSVIFQVLASATTPFKPLTPVAVNIVRVVSSSTNPSGRQPIATVQVTYVVVLEPALIRDGFAPYNMTINIIQASVNSGQFITTFRTLASAAQLTGILSTVSIPANLNKLVTFPVAFTSIAPSRSPVTQEPTSLPTALPIQHNITKNATLHNNSPADDSLPFTDYLGIIIAVGTFVIVAIILLYVYSFTALNNRWQVEKVMSLKIDSDVHGIENNVDMGELYPHDEKNAVTRI